MDPMSQAAAPDPFSRQGAGDAHGLGQSAGEPDKFSTGADGFSPLSTPPMNAPNAAAASAPQPPQATAPQGPSPYQDAYDQAANYQQGASYPPAPYSAAQRAPEDTYEPSQQELQARPGNFPTYPYGTGAQSNSGRYPGQQLQQSAGYYRSPYGAPMIQSGMSTASLILGILSFMIVFLGPVAIGLGVGGLKQVRREPARYTGSGVAIGGIVTGTLSTLMMVLFFAVALLAS